MTLSSEPTARTTNDLIATVPHQLGYHPRDSLVAITFRPRHGAAAALGTSVRIDCIPRTAHACLRALPNLLTAIPGTSCVALVVFNESFDDDVSGKIRRHYAGAIKGARPGLRQRGIALLSASWVGRERCGELLELALPDPGDDQSDLPGRALSTARETAVAAYLAYRGSSPADAAPDHANLPTDAARLAAVEAARQKWRGEKRHLDTDSVLGRGLVLLREDLALLCRRALEVRAADGLFAEADAAELGVPRAETIAALSDTMSQLDLRDVVLALLGLHPEVTADPGLQLLGESDIVGYVRDPDRMLWISSQIPGLSPDQPPELMVGTVIELVRSWARAVQGVERAHVLALAAWLEWSVMHNSAGEQYVKAARNIDPDYRLAALVEHAMEIAMPPAWVSAHRRN